MKIRRTLFTTELEISVEELNHIDNAQYEDQFGESLLQRIINFICDLD